jgi:hypothetical protein
MTGGFFLFPPFSREVMNTARQVSGPIPETRGGSVKFEIYNGDFIGTCEWKGPRDVDLDIQDETERRWFESYFSAQDTFLHGPIGGEDMAPAERRDASEASFGHALFLLAAYEYMVREADERKKGAHAGART